MSNSANDRDRCPYPKHRGKLWRDVVVEDREYMEWMVGGEGPGMSDEVYDLLIELLETYPE